MSTCASSNGIRTGSAIAINPEGEVPVLEHDGTTVTDTTVINEAYLEDVFQDAQPDSGPLRPRDPAGAGRRCATGTSSSTGMR